MSASTEPVVETGSSRVRWIALAVFLVMAVLVVILATRPQAENASGGTPLIGQPAPELEGTALDGSSVDIASMKGRYVVVNFFATWCGPCLQEHPELITFTQRHQSDSGPAVVAVAFQDATSNVKNFFEREGGAWPVVPDESGSIAVDFGVRGLPETYIIDPEGKVAAHYTGQITANTLERVTGGVA